MPYVNVVLIVSGTVQCFESVSSLPNECVERLILPETLMERKKCCPRGDKLQLDPHGSLLPPLDGCVCAARRDEPNDVT